MKKVHRVVALSVRLFGIFTKKSNRKRKMSESYHIWVVMMASSRSMVGIVSSYGTFPRVSLSYPP